MKKIIKPFILSVLALQLSACGGSLMLSHTQIRHMSKEPLANGSYAYVNGVAPQDNWQCQHIGEQSYNWAVDQMKGNLKLGGGYEVLREQALAYANNNNLNPNYIQLTIPEQVGVNGMNVTAFSKARATFYKCQNPIA